MKNKKIIFSVSAAGIVILICLQFIRPQIPLKPVTGDFEAPEHVKAIVRRACYDCHSNQTNLRWFDKISPVYWRVAAHVNAGRAGLNFSEWDKLAPGDRKAKLWEAVNQIIAGAMPLKDYEFVHHESKISPQDLAVLKDYMAAMVKRKPGDTSIINAAQKQKNVIPTAQSPMKLPVSLNGISYMPEYKHWQAISTTERMDNGTMRVIFGNDIAVSAIHSHKINPWPDGTIFAKVAWDQLEDKAGNVSTGAFKQIEYMIKDHERFKSTHGWGFARFKTPRMVPYGKTVMFTNECMNCHKPQEDQDFVFTSPLNN
ncbi:cytochrome P460 [Mucilaginibacter ginsenosidivorans]|uniref:Cytochrome P460 n=2 Tax=Mucilaginibacter ginsenosidivorans TaxID=398053 RepID=A0A5B8V3S8_9SPHI|nr:cytochrome P460 [Mucilaginibacter ginsenosidivorans]